MWNLTAIMWVEPKWNWTVAMWWQANLTVIVWVEPKCEIEQWPTDDRPICGIWLQSCGCKSNCKFDSNIKSTGYGADHVKSLWQKNLHECILLHRSPWKRRYILQMILACLVAYYSKLNFQLDAYYLKRNFQLDAIFCPQLMSDLLLCLLNLL